MTLNERESRALEQLRRFLEQDDPALARRPHSMRCGPTASGLALFVLTAILVGLVLIGIGQGLDLSALSTLGVLCVPIGGSMWFGRLNLPADTAHALCQSQ